jgi:hypothetical protein
MYEEGQDYDDFFFQPLKVTLECVSILPGRLCAGIGSTVVSTNQRP